MNKDGENVNLDDLARMVADGFKTMVTKDNLDTLRQEIRSDVDVLLDKHLGTYMQR